MNNRQAGGRRRGRGGQRQGGNPGRPDNGNRIDNRARGNAAQLLEKYKNLASDAQRAGDRVNTEYYLQFADHYFRVLSESRSRFEEQQPQQRRSRDDEMDEGEDDYGLEGEPGSPAAYQPAYQPEEDERPQRREREQRQPREGREPRVAAPARDDRDGSAPREERPRREVREPRMAAPQREDRESEAPREDYPRREAANDEPRGEVRRRGRPRRDAAEAPANEGFDASVLPPAIGADPVEVAPAAEDRPRRTRTRRPREAGDEAVPPAA